jgi:LysR family glycine cleavage system transcriptional activator
MKARDLPLSALRAFTVAARSSSLAAAASELGVTHGAISKQISVLEAWLEQRVFTRDGRRLVLTPYGQFLADRVGKSLDEIQGACEYVKRQRTQFVVSVEAPSTFSMYWLLPRLVQFQAEMPNITIWTSTRQTGQSPDLSQSDVVITRGNLTASPTRLQQPAMLFDEHLTVISSPQLLARLPVRSASDVTHHNLITATTRPGQWEAWLKRFGVDYKISGGGHRFDHLFVAMHAVRDGLGSIIAPKNLFDEAFSRRELVAPLPALTLKGEPYFAYRTARAEGRHVNMFIEWLSRTGAASQAS